MSFAPSPARSENELTIPSGLKLPDGQTVPGDNDETEFILFSVEEYKTIVHIYNGYVLYDKNRDYILRLRLLDSRIEEVRLQHTERMKEMRDDLKAEVDSISSIWSEEHKLRLKENSRNNVREVFIGLGAGLGGVVLGVAAGIIIATVAQ